MLIILIGASGTGKTTIARALMDAWSEARFLPSHTTRAPRPNDIDGEFTHLKREAFEHLRDAHAFLWTADFGTTSVGTREEDLKMALMDENHPWLSVLIPSVIPLVYDYAKTLDRERAILPILIESEADEVLMERMRMRGDSEEKIEERLRVTKKFDEEAHALGIPLISIRNHGIIDEAVAQVLEVIQSQSRTVV